MRLEKISSEFERKLAELSAGIISSQDFENLLAIFETEIKQVYFTASSEANLIRIIQNMIDKGFLIRECIKYPHYVEILVSIATNSNYLTDILIINPEYFYWIVNPSILNKKIYESTFQNEIKSTLAHYNSLQAKVHALKSLKRKELLRIGLQDIYLKVTLEEITNALSILAKCLTESIFTICWDKISRKYGLQSQTINYCLIALGKLGGKELNYSSDIDLIIFYEKEKRFKNKKYLSEILTEAIQLFIKLSSDITGGFLYRVDLRLRPDGRNSSLCRSLNEYLNYYEIRGEVWERQMLIKAAFLGGKKSLYNKFTEYLQPFIYPSTLSVSPGKQISRIKKNIEDKIKGEGNIKLIPGGIRDIEFAVQALQLLNGGKQKNLRAGNTLQVIDALSKNNCLNRNEGEILKTAYKFYRQIEHYLQLMNNRQTHVIPAEGELLKKMSYQLGYTSSEDFNINVRKTRSKVRKIFTSILNNHEQKEQTSFSIDKINFVDINRAASDFEFLRDGKGITGTRTFDTKSIENFQQIENKIYNYLKNSNNPDKTLSNLTRIIKYAEFPSIWYRELEDNTFCDYVMSICEFSQYSIDLFAEDKKLREFLLSRKLFTKISPGELIDTDIKTILFYFSVQVTLNLLDPLKSSDLLSKIVRQKAKRLIEKHNNELAWDKDYIVAALGSLGSSALTFFSDLDLIFIIRNPNKYSEIEKHFQKLLASLRINFKPFTVDCRLRPEGKSSQLVWDIEEYKTYFYKRARTWEFQSITKIMFVAGNKRLFNNFAKASITSIKKFDNKQIKRDLIEMRNQISSQKLSSSLEIFDTKRSCGGLIDIEFIVQYLILSNSVNFNQSLGKTFLDQLKSISKLNSSERNDLIDAYSFWKNVQLLNQIIYNRTTSKIVLEENKLNAIAQKMHMKENNRFITELKTNSKKVRDIYNKLFK